MHRAFAVLLVVWVAVPAVGPAAGAPGAHGASCVGPVERPADGVTLVTTRGFRPVGDTIEKRPALLLAVDGRGRPVRSRNLTAHGRFAGRAVAVDPGGILLVSREGTHTVVERLDEEFRPVRAVRFGVEGGPRADVEVRDAYPVPGGFVVADDDRVLRYDLEAGRTRREWSLPEDAATGPESRITAVAPAEDGYLVAVAGNGTGSVLAVRDGGVAWRVDGLADPVDAQSLGDTALVTEAAGGRVTEVDRSGEAVWSLTGLDRPQAARRLPGGRTLVAEGGSHRVVTVTPRGRAVWTTYAPWEPADATRDVAGDAPTADRLGATGQHALEAENATYTELAACEARLAALGANRSERARTVADDGAPVGAVAVLALGAAALAVAARRAAGRVR